MDISQAKIELWLLYTKVDEIDKKMNILTEMSTKIDKVLLFDTLSS